MGGIEKHTNALDARESFQSSLDEVTSDPRPWAAAVWKIADGKIALVKLTTNKFPHGDMLTAVAQLADKFAGQQKASIEVPVPDPLPSANLDSFLKRVFVPGEEKTQGE